MMEYGFFFVVGLLMLQTVLIAVLLLRTRRASSLDLEILIRNFWENYGKTDLHKNFQELNTAFRDEFSRSRSEYQNYQKNFQDSLLKNLHESHRSQKEQLYDFSKQLMEMSKANEIRLNRNTDIMEKKMGELMEQNNQKLEKMRETVDEKLQKTLETRLHNSFNSVNQMLERVQKGLGEMNKLSEGVSGLNRVLSNVKTRGILGEYQLENILEQLLTSSQYAKDVQTNPQTTDKVEFAIRLPGHKDNEEVWIPVDSKFPIEVYQKVLEAYELNDGERIKSDRKALEATIKTFAKQVKKYINPPRTTDFAIIFIPIEGLYAEIVRNPTLIDFLINQEKILLAGPNNFAAFLSALQVGFRTLSIEKHSAEVWKLLASVKKGFEQFGGLLDKTHKKIEEASSVISKARDKTRTIERKLKKVENTPLAAPSNDEVQTTQMASQIALGGISQINSDSKDGNDDYDVAESMPSEYEEELPFK